MLQPPPATGLKSNWNGVPVPFFSNSSYSCAKSTTFFLADRNLEAWNLTCLPGGVWQTPVWPSCVTSMTSICRIKQGVSVLGLERKGRSFFCQKHNRVSFCKKQRTRRVLFSAKHSGFSKYSPTNHTVLGLSPKKVFYRTCYIHLEENMILSVEMFVLPCML